MANQHSAVCDRIAEGDNLRRKVIKWLGVIGFINFVQNSLDVANNVFKISLTFDQVLDLFLQLPKRDRVRLSNELAKDAADKRLSRLLNVFNTNEFTEEEINNEVEKTRKETYSF